MLKKVAISLALVLNYIGFTSCNSSDSSYNGYGEVVLSSDVAVNGFSLLKNNKILNNLDSVYFSIDLDNARIFNADSLPVGTDISRLQVSISTTSVTVAELKFRNRNDVDTVINYLESTNDSINFAAGPVTLHLVAANGETKRDYSIEVNVHKMAPDSLYWNINRRRQLPGSINKPTKQKTVELAGTIYCLTTDGSTCSIASTANPEGSWTTENITFPFTPDIESLTATDNSLFILDNTGKLYRSSDAGKSWTASGPTWYHITGAYGTRLLGITYESGTYYTVTYPETDKTKVDSQFPVKGNSQLFKYATKWSVNPQVVMLGGRNAEGKALSDTWAYDGEKWANLSSRRPVAAEGMTMFPYYVCTTDTMTWRTSKREVLVALGGLTDADTINRKVFISGDLGFTWRQAGQLMQLPEYIPSMMNSQAFVCNTTFTTARSSSEWETLMPRKLPFWLKPVTSRATAPITEWDAPYVYLVGGCDKSGNLYNTIWTGAINTLTFKPLQ